MSAASVNGPKMDPNTKEAAKEAKKEAKKEANAKQGREKTVDEVYLQKDWREHMLARPDTNIGSVKFVVEDAWVHDSAYDPSQSSDPSAAGEKISGEKRGEKEGEKEGEKAEEEKDAKGGDAVGGGNVGQNGGGDGGRRGRVPAARMVYRSIRYVPGLYKIVDEALVNASDQVQRGVGVTTIKVDIDQTSVSVYNNGDGLPVKRMAAKKKEKKPKGDEKKQNGEEKKPKGGEKKQNGEEKSGDAKGVENGGELGVWVPQFAFGEFLVSSNFDDGEMRTTGGRNGYGIKCTITFSKRFILDVQDAKEKLHYKQTWKNNMSEMSEPKITARDKASYTKVTFEPDFRRFGGMTCFDADITALLQKRVYDLAATCGPKVRVYLNGKRIAIRSLHDYAKCFAPFHPKEDSSLDTADPADPFDRGQDANKNKDDGGKDDGGMGGGGELVYESVGKRWQVCVGMSDEGQGFQQMSFVNSICTSKGGQHVNCVVDQLIEPIRAAVKKKSKDIQVTPQMVRNHLFVFVNATIVNPVFDSQTKNTLVTEPDEFGSKCVLAQKTLKRIVRKSGIVDTLLDSLENKSSKLLKKTDGSLRGDPKVDKLHDATATSAKDRQLCTLILTEGDSAKALAMAGLSVVGRKYYGVFALRGKPVNPRDAGLKTVLANKELIAIKKILGLKNGETYTDTSKLRYGHMCIMADADTDGSHIVGLVVNMMEFYWPDLLKINGFLLDFITPAVKATKGQETISFWSEPEYQKWKRDNNDGQGWHIKHYKGLGTNTSLEGKQYFSDLAKHTIPFRAIDGNDHSSLELAFSKKPHMAAARRKWIGDYKTIDPHNPERETQTTMPELRGQTNGGGVSVKDFVNTQLIQFAIANNERQVPSLVDGFKKSGRKILFSAFKRNLVREIKVASLAGFVIDVAAYLHGEASCTGAIVNMAQDYVGSNNVNLLVPSGQFGTRAELGADAASARYINTALHPITRTLFSPEDAPILLHLTDEGRQIEPIYYLPILPLVLINGAKGIGSGWSTHIPPHNPRQIAAIIKTAITPHSGSTSAPPICPTIAAPEAKPAADTSSALQWRLDPWVRGFRGSITLAASGTSYVVCGCLNIVESSGGECEVRIHEVPYMISLSAYVSSLRKMKDDNRILSVQDESTEDAVLIIVRLNEKQRKTGEERGGLLKYLKLQSTIHMNNLVAFAPTGQLKRYASAREMLLEFIEFRLPFFAKRKEELIRTLTTQLNKLQQRARFIRMVIHEPPKLTVRNVPKKNILSQLKQHAFPPIHKNATSQNSTMDATDARGGNDEEKAPEDRGDERGYDYLLGMPLWSLTKERVNELQDQEAEKAKEIERLQKTDPAALWARDIDNFIAKLDECEVADAKKRSDSIVRQPGKTKRKQTDPKTPQPPKKRKTNQ